MFNMRRRGRVINAFFNGNAIDAGVESPLCLREARRPMRYVIRYRVPEEGWTENAALGPDEALHRSLALKSIGWAFDVTDARTRHVVNEADLRDAVSEATQPAA